MSFQLKAFIGTSLFLLVTILYATMVSVDNKNLKEQVKVLTKDKEDLAKKLEVSQKQGTEAYENASLSCRESIRSAVAAVRLKTIEVPRYAEDGSPNPACPAVSLRDIQAAGSPSVPAGSDR